MEAEPGVTIDQAFLPLLLAMALASYACRAAGFYLMGFVPGSPRIEAALRATPLAVMVGISVPALMSGRLPEIAGLAVIVVLARVMGSDAVPAFAGIAMVALLRAFL
jgi:uncharacterized membrane protein